MCGARRRGGRGARARARAREGRSSCAHHVVALAGQDGHGARAEDRPVGGEGRAFRRGRRAGAAEVSGGARAEGRERPLGVGSDPLGRHPSQRVDGARSLCASGEARRGFSNRSREEARLALDSRARASALMLSRARARFPTRRMIHFVLRGGPAVDARALDRAMGCGGESSSRPLGIPAFENAIGVEKRSVEDITPEAFERDYVSRCMPMVLTDVTASWPCARKWSLRYFAEAHGDVEVVADDGTPRGCDVPFASTSRGSTSSRTPPRRAEPPPPTSARGTFTTTSPSSSTTSPRTRPTSAISSRRSSPRGSPLSRGSSSAREAQGPGSTSTSGTRTRGSP